MSKDDDVFRDSLLRYAGCKYRFSVLNILCKSHYTVLLIAPTDANEVGEAFRYQFPKGVVPSYAVAMTYVTADMVDKARKAYIKGGDAMVIAYTAADAFIWQTLASVVVPGVTIHQVVYWTRKALKANVPAVSRAGAVTTWVPTMLGLGVIPLIIRPIDHAIDFLLDNTTRTLAASIIETTASVPGTTDASPAERAVHSESPRAGEKLSASSLLAAAPIIASKCAAVNGDFVQCKNKHQDPEACLHAGESVIACTISTIGKLRNGKGQQGDCFKRYEECIDRHGGELAKCSEYKTAMEDAFRSMLLK